MIPAPLWIVLFLSAGIIFLFMLFFADSAERAFVQATMMGGVAVVITSMLLLLWFLDNPYHRASAGCDRSRWSARWGSSTRQAQSSARLEVPCDERGCRAAELGDGTPPPRTGSTSCRPCS